MLDKSAFIFKLHIVSLTLHSDFLKLQNSEPYLLGISGGRDSVALLHLLLENNYSNLVLCHLNHGLRGEDATGDAQLVSELAEKYQLQAELGHTDIKLLMQQNSQSMETAARHARHQFFAQCAIKHNSSNILLAHHADDQAETILFNLLRGSAGLRGMSYQTQYKINGIDIQFLRPLLTISRANINAYLEEHNILYRDDSTNAEAIATRNRLRNEAIPLLENIMGRDIRQPLLRAEKVISLNELALKQELAGYQLKDPQGRLFLPTIQSLSPALQRIALYDYFKAHQVPDISDRLLTQSLTLLEKNPEKSKINLPGDSHFRRKEKRLFIEGKKN